MKRFRWLITSFLSLAIAIALLLIFSGGAQAQMLKMSLEELTDGADSIVVGTVVSSSSHWNADLTNIYTEVVISVEDTLKGPTGKNTITIIVPGGTVGEITQSLEDTPVFEAGEKVGLFLEELNSAGLAQMGLGATTQLLAAGPPSSVYGSFQGKLSFTEDKPGTRSKMSLNEFKQNVNLALAGQSIPEEQSPPLIPEGTAYQTISSISPSTASAGTNTMVTVSGSGFGTRGANDHLVFYFGTSGGVDYYMYDDSTIVSWSDTQIKAYVPVAIISDALNPGPYSYSAASGPVAVYKNGSLYSFTPFTVTFGYGQSKWSGTNPTVPYRVNEGGVSGRLTAIQAATNSWSNAGASFSFSYGGTTSATTIGQNGVNEVLWQDLPTGVLGAASHWTSGSTITECDFAFNTDYTWSTASTCPSGQFDVQSIGVHELGHWLNLRDLYGDKAGYPQDTAKIMYGYSSSGQTKRNLHSHDILGIQWIYAASLTAPTVTNSTGANNITDTGAMLNGEVTLTGGENPTVHIYWGASDGGTTAGNWAHDVNLGAKAAGTFYTDISSLISGTPYYYRCYAVNSGGGSWAASTASFTTTGVAPQKLIGADAGASTSGAYPANYFFLYRFQAVDTGNVVTFKIKTSGSGNVKVAIYADNAGAPGALLNAVNTSTAVVAGWNDITIGSTSVTAGSYYWLAYSSSAAIGYYQSTGGTARYKTVTYSSFAFPNPAGTGFASLTSNGLLAGWGFVVPPTAPTVTNGSGASDIGSYTAMLNGEITDTGNQDPTVHIYWGPTDGGTTAGNWDHDVNLGIMGTATFQINISGLTASTPYYYRSYAVNSGGGSWAGSTVTFTTLAPPTAPTVTNSTGASSVLSTTARLNGEITATGGENPTVHIYWGPTDGGTTAGSWAHDENLGAKVAETFYTDISGLTASTPYYYRCYAVNSGGSDWADSTETFTTATAPQKLIGADAGASTSGAYPANYFFLYRFQAVDTGSVVTFKIKTSGSGNVKVAIYADNAGAPGALLNAVNTSTAVVAGWNNITIASTSVTAGNYYWLAYNPSAAIGYYQSTGGTLRYKTATYSTFTFPNPAGTGFASLTSNGLLAGWGFVVLPAPPPAPILVSPGTSITFKWNASAGATKYYLEVNTSATFDGTSLFDSEVGNVTLQEVTGFSLGTTYYWRVRAGNTGGWSDWSSVRSVIANEVP